MGESTLYHLIFCRGIMSDRTVPRWQYWPTLRRVYISCPCGTLLPVTLRNIHADGFVGGRKYHSCVLCPFCHRHSWPFLEGWAEVTKMWKAGREKRARAKAKATRVKKMVGELMKQRA